jgi:histidyl-tRNA synthetase
MNPSAADSAPDIVVGFMTEAEHLTAVKITAALRRSGKKVEISLTPEKPKKFFSKAGKCEAKEAIYIGPDDIESGTIRIKNLKDRNEEKAEISEILKREKL